MKIVKSLWLWLFMAIFVLPFVAAAQEPTDRPFPAVPATATERAFPVAPATATKRAFPTAATTDPEATANTAINASDAEATPELLLADVQATANAAEARVAQLESERESLRTELEASQADNGATTFALAIIVIGVVLALAVFFGLRRGGE